MQTVFSLHDIWNDKKINKSRLISLIGETGVQTNDETISRILNNTIKRLPLDVAGAICKIFNIDIDDWIHVVDSPIELRCTTTPMNKSHSLPTGAILIDIKTYMDSKGWKQTDLVQRLLDHGLPDRKRAVHKLYHSDQARLPVDLIAPICAELGITPGSWIIAPREAIAVDTTQIHWEQTLQTVKEVAISLSQIKEELSRKSSQLHHVSLLQLLQNVNAVETEFSTIQSEIEAVTEHNKEASPALLMKIQQLQIKPKF